MCNDLSGERPCKNCEAFFYARAKKFWDRPHFFVLRFSGKNEARVRKKRILGWRPMFSELRKTRNQSDFRGWYNFLVCRGVCGSSRAYTTRFSSCNRIATYMQSLCNLHAILLHALAIIVQLLCNLVASKLWLQFCA